MLDKWMAKSAYKVGECAFTDSKLLVTAEVTLIEMQI